MGVRAPPTTGPACRLRSRPGHSWLSVTPPACDNKPLVRRQTQAHIMRHTMNESRDGARGAGGEPGETVPFVPGGGGDDSYVTSESAPPRLIGRYRVVRRIAQGGFGRVYLAHDDDLDRPVAIKLPNP